MEENATVGVILDDDLQESSRRIFELSKSKDGSTQQLKIHLATAKKHYEEDGTDDTRFKAFLNQKDELGNTPQHYAAREGKPDFIELLKEFGANLQAEGQKKMTVANFATHYGKDEKGVWECILKIIKLEGYQWRYWRCGIWIPAKSFNIAEPDRHGFNILHHAIQNNLWTIKNDETCNGHQIIEHLINLQEIKVSDSDNQNNNILHLALLHEKPEVFSFLLKRANDSSSSSSSSSKQYKLQNCSIMKNLSGKMPLHIAVQNGDVNNKVLKEMVQWMTRHLPLKTINVKDNDGYSPLQLAILSKNPEAVKILLQFGADIGEENEKPNALHVCSRFGDAACMDSLIQFAVEDKKKHLLYAKDDEGRTPLFLATENNEKEIIKALMSKLSEKEKKESTDNQGRTPLMIALRTSNYTVVKELCKDLNQNEWEQQDKEENNLFHFACLSENPAKTMDVLVNVFRRKKESDLDESELIRKMLPKENKSKETPLHILASKTTINIKEEFDLISEILKGEPIMELMTKRNLKNETPIHISAKTGSTTLVSNIVSREEYQIKLKELNEKMDFDGNTPLHLSCQSKNLEMTELLLECYNKKEVIEAISRENNLGWTPFSGAVCCGDIEILKLMSKYIKSTSVLLNKADFTGMRPIHLSAKYGHVDIFEYLLQKGANLTMKGPLKKTALDFAIEKEERGIIKSIINNKQWKTAFRIPSISPDGLLDTPLRKLITSFPDLAETVLDKCYQVTGDEKIMVQMDFELVEDTYNYKNQHDIEIGGNWWNCWKKIKGKNSREAEFVHFGSDPKQCDDIFNAPYSNSFLKNHPLMIMANEGKLDLLQHPLCLSLISQKWKVYGRIPYYTNLLCYLVFLTFLSIYILTSPGPLEDPGLFNCDNWRFLNASSFANGTIPPEYLHNSDLNYAGMTVVYTICVIRILFLLFITQEWRILGKGLIKFGSDLLHLNTPSLDDLPIGFSFEVVTYVAAFYVVADRWSKFEWNETGDDVSLRWLMIRSCTQWNISAFAIWAAWLNLLLHMRQLYIIGKFIILFDDVIITFLSFMPVFFIMIISFGLAFNILLPNNVLFSTPEQSLLKTLIMFTGEFDFGDIFFPEKQPMPYTESTYTLFCIFLVLVSIIALNVMIGLTVDRIVNFLENADIKKLAMTLNYVLQMEENIINLYRKTIWIQFLKIYKIYKICKTYKIQDIQDIQASWNLDASWKENKKGKNLDKKENMRQNTLTSDLVSKVKIWEKIERKQMECKRQAEIKENDKSLKDFIKKIMRVNTERENIFKKLNKKLDVKLEGQKEVALPAKEVEDKDTTTSDHEDENEDQFDAWSSSTSTYSSYSGSVEMEGFRSAWKTDEAVIEKLDCIPTLMNNVEEMKLLLTNIADEIKANRKSRDPRRVGEEATGLRRMDSNLI